MAGTEMHRNMKRHPSSPKTLPFDQQACQWRTDHGGQGLREVEQRQICCGTAREPGKPETEWRRGRSRPRRRRADPQRVEARDVLHEGEQHDTMPTTMIRASHRRAPTLYKAMLLKFRKIAGEEDARREPELGGAQSEIVVRPFGRERDRVRSR
jgi:hypothetical protein